VLFPSVQAQLREISLHRYSWLKFLTSDVTERQMYDIVGIDIVKKTSIIDNLRRQKFSDRSNRITEDGREVLESSAIADNSRDAARASSDFRVTAVCNQ